jgi:hypothetical protein
MLAFAIVCGLLSEVTPTKVMRRRKLVSDVEDVVANVNQKIFTRLAEERVGKHSCLC